jgi:hypothetical protein
MLILDFGVPRTSKGLPISDDSTELTFALHETSPAATLPFQKLIPFQDWNTPLTEPGQALQRALVRTELPVIDRLPAPLLQAAFPSLAFGADLTVPGPFGAQSRG